VIQGIFFQLRVIRACARNDIRAALRDRLFTIIGLFVPLNVLVLMSLFVLGGGYAPTAVVVEDHGKYAQAFLQAMSQAHSFRLEETSASDAEQLITAGQIVAIVTIPPDFDARIQQGQPVQVDVKINNLNTDFTNDIRRAVPLSITTFYAKAFPNLVAVSMSEHDLYRTDTDYISYLTVSILVIALMIGGLLQAGTASAKEWENQTIKELLLSPASRWAIMTGKMLGAFVMGLGSTLLMLLVLIFLVGVRPEYWLEMIGFSLLGLMIFTSLGTLFGTLLKQRQPVIAMAMGTSLPLFFLSGAFGPISFSPLLLQFLAKLFPVYYLIVVFQRAFHGFALNTYGLLGNSLILCAYALGLIILVTIALQRAAVSH
jgi:ABC-type multidrug transport system permease subunit